MAQWNSDGYIFIDFKDVNFSLTNQTVSGIYQRMVDIVGTNKFILVLNANGRTPMPGTISLTNGQYVIDTVLYMFSISSNDNLFIRRQDIPAGDIIDDENISISSTYSSYKIDNTYQKKLTAGDNITISDNTISATDTTYTAGDNVSISADNVISATDTTYTAGTNVSISADNVISATDTTYTAGDNVSISADNVISATDTTYTAGTGIAISAGNEIACDITSFAITANSASGSTVSFNTNMATNLVACSVDIDSVSGVSAINISATGKNLADITAQTVTAQSRIVDNLHLNKGDYMFSISVVNNTSIGGLFAIRIGTTNIATVGFSANFEGVVSTTFNLTDNSVINIVLGGSSAGYSFDISNAQIEIGTEATDYEPYNGTFNTITIGSTVNEGVYDARTGILEVTSPSAQTIQLPPCPITNKLGENNIWADSGNISVVYNKLEIT